MGNLCGKAVWGLVALLCLSLPTPGFAQALRARLDNVLTTVTSGEREVIVRPRAGRKATVRLKVAQRDSHYEEHGLLEAFTVKLKAKEIVAFANDPDIESISDDAEVTAMAGAGKGASKKAPAPAVAPPVLPMPSDAVSDVKLSLGLGNWFSGSGVTVAVIDSGLAPGPDFDGRIVGFYDFTSGRSGVTSTPSDEYGHGTHVAGLIGSSGASSSFKYGGVAPGVKFLALKVLDRKGAGKTSDVIRALEFAVANKARFGIKVVNLSLGHPVFEPAASDPLVNAVEAAVRSGLIVVVAAGNYGRNPVTGITGFAGIASPGNAPSAITVGAAVTNGTVARDDDRLAPFSSRGPSWYDGIAKPDVLGPGHAMVSNAAPRSTLEKDYPGLVVMSGTEKFLKLSGSSMATGVVSGLVAAMLEANVYGADIRWQAYQETLQGNQLTAFVAPPALTNNAVKALIQYSATPLHDADGTVYSPLEQGTGLVNGAGALGLAYFADTTKAVGEYWMTSSLPRATSFGGTEEVWSQSLTWGTRLLQGDSVVDVRQFAWDDNIVWGTGEMDNIVWGTVSDDGDNIVWGTVADDGDNIVWGTSFKLSVDLNWLGNAELGDNIVWGTGVVWDDNIVWGTGLVGFFDGDNIVWGTYAEDGDNIVWGTLSEDNIVWGTLTPMNKIYLPGLVNGWAQ